MEGEPDRYAGTWRDLDSCRANARTAFRTRCCTSPVQVGEPILLTALISEAGLPVTGCTVEVEATAPNGTSSSLALADDGAHQDGEIDDGEYATAFTHTPTPGICHFKFRVVGKSREGKIVVREAVRDKPVLGRQRPGRDTIGLPPTGQPVDGERPEPEDCCPELRDEIRMQTRLLEDLFGSRELRRSR